MMINHLMTTLTRLEASLDDAIDAMKSRDGTIDDQFSAAKGRALVTLNRIADNVEPSSLNSDQHNTIIRIRQKLNREKELLEHRLAASRLVSQLISEAMIAGDWDGTYTAASTHQTILGASTP